MNIKNSNILWSVKQHSTQLKQAPAPMTFKAKIPDFLRYQDHHEQIEIETFTCKLYKSIWFWPLSWSYC